jgi:2',3'-cyclic-nucleotide 2'-phosphodiesterase (5'-nucleotidase family)
MRQQAAELRREGADFVVSVVHANRAEDNELFATRAFDLILTGDDHDLYVNYDGRTAMVESSADAHYVTAIDVTINVTEHGGQRRMTWWPRFRIIDTADVVPDPEVAAEVAKLEAEMSKEFDVALGTTAVELDSRNATVRTREAAIGNLFADALRESTGADIGLTNGGGIRAAKLYPAGSSITRRDILAELAFGNRIALIGVTGKALREAMENGLSVYPQASGRFPQISGMTIEADSGRPPGSRVVAIKVGGVPLDENKTYRLATNDFIGRGGDGYVMLRDAPVLGRDYDAPLMANEIMAYVRKLGTVRTRVDGRVTVK